MSNFHEASNEAVRNILNGVPVEKAVDDAAAKYPAVDKKYLRRAVEASIDIRRGKGADSGFN